MAPFGALLSHVASLAPSRFIHVSALDRFYNLTRLYVSQNRSIIDKAVTYVIKQHFIEMNSQVIPQKAPSQIEIRLA